MKRLTSLCGITAVLVLAAFGCGEDATKPLAPPEIAIGECPLLAAAGGAASLPCRIVNPAEGGGISLK